MRFFRILAELDNISKNINNENAYLLPLAPHPAAHSHPHILPIARPSPHLHRHHDDSPQNKILFIRIHASYPPPHHVHLPGSRIREILAGCISVHWMHPWRTTLLRPCQVLLVALD